MARFKVKAYSKKVKNFDWGTVYPHLIEFPKQRAGFGGGDGKDSGGNKIKLGDREGWVDLIDCGILERGKIYSVDDANIRSKASKDGSFFFWSIRGPVTDEETGEVSEKKDAKPSGGGSSLDSDAMLGALISIQALLEKIEEHLRPDKAVSCGDGKDTPDLDVDPMPDDEELPF